MSPYQADSLDLQTITKPSGIMCESSERSVRSRLLIRKFSLLQIVKAIGGGKNLDRVA